MRRLLLLSILCLAPAWAAGELSNRRAPGFSLPDSNIQQHDIADYRGRIVLLELMQTSCPHCVKFAGVLEEISRKYAGRVQVLSIVTPPDTTATVGPFIRQHNITYPILFDCGQATGSYMMATPQKPSFDIPHVFLIDQEGIIRNDFGYGPLTTAIFEGRGLFAEVDKMLASPGGGAPPKAAPKKR
jgi:peroxiredoxin